MACVTDVPDDVLWLVLRKVIYIDASASVHEYQRNVVGYRVHGRIAKIVLRLAHTHPKFRRCIRRRCIWHSTGAWDFVRGSFFSTPRQPQLLDLPDNVLWIILRKVFIATVLNIMHGYAFSEYRDGAHGYSKKGTIATTVLRLAQIHPTLRRCIKRRCVWHTTNGLYGWDFVVGSLK